MAADTMHYELENAHCGHHRGRNRLRRGFRRSDFDEPRPDAIMHDVDEYVGPVVVIDLKHQIIGPDAVINASSVRGCAGHRYSRDETTHGRTRDVHHRSQRTFEVI